MTLKRANTPRRQLTADEVEVLSRLTRSSASQTSRWLKPVLAYLIVAMFCAGYFLHVGREAGRSFSAGLSNESIQFASVSAKSGRLAALCPPPAIGRPWDGSFAAMTPSLGDHFSDEAEKFLRVAEFMACVMARNVERLCERQSRQALVTDLRRYEQHLTSIRRFSAKLFAEPKDQLEVFALVDIHHSDRVRVLSENITNADELVMSRVAKLAKAGHLSKSDFGVFGFGIPASVEPHLAPGQPVQSGCS